MNLHAVVSNAIGAVNPQIFCTIAASTGYTTNAAGLRTPTYQTFVGVQCQVQPLTGDDLRQLDGLNLQGTHRSIHVNGTWNGVSRPLIKGGDKVTLPDCTTWLVTKALEQWPNWTRLAVTLQQPGS